MIFIQEFLFCFQDISCRQSQALEFQFTLMHHLQPWLLQNQWEQKMNSILWNCSVWMIIIIVYWFIGLLKAWIKWACVRSFYFSVNDIIIAGCRKPQSNHIKAVQLKWTKKKALYCQHYFIRVVCVRRIFEVQSFNPFTFFNNSNKNSAK